MVVVHWIVYGLRNMVSGSGPLDRVRPEEHGQWQCSHWVVYSLRSMVSGSGSTGSCTA